MASLLLASCASPRKQETGAGPQFGPQGPQEAGTPPGQIIGEYGPQPAQRYPLVVVMGPGRARSFSYVGVIKELQTKKIPVGAVAGTGMGALVAASYATSETLNDFEWKMTRFKNELIDPEAFRLNSFFDKTARRRELTATLDKIFQGRDISQSRKTLRIGVYSESTGNFTTLSRGKISEAVSLSISQFEFREAEGKSIDDEGFLVDEARDLNLGPIIAIDVRTADTPPSESAIKELRRADVVLVPSLIDITPSDFGKRNSIIFRGRRAVTESIERIKQLAGLDQEEHSS